MMAACQAAGMGHTVCLYERNEKLGKKLFITGKGRCNVTNAAPMDQVMKNVVTNPRFLYSAFQSCTNRDVMNMLERAGVPLKVERGERVFPVSDRSSDVIRGFEKILKEYGVEIHLHARAEGIWIENNRCRGILFRGKKLFADGVILATGGLSYPSTGSDGDGYRFAREAGHHITPLYPSLVPFNAEGEGVKGLQGLALKNIHGYFYADGKLFYDEMGELLFTHFGVSGPIVLSASARATGAIRQKKLNLKIDLKPGLSEVKLDERLLRDFKEFQNKQFKNALGKLLPLKLIDLVIAQSGIHPEKKVNEITKKERYDFIKILKGLDFTLASPRGYNEAVITKGGVNIGEVNPKTMESKLLPGLYICGELLDLDANTGGYNLQIAWSTGFCAGGSIGYV